MLSLMIGFVLGGYVEDSMPSRRFDKDRRRRRQWHRSEDIMAEQLKPRTSAVNGRYWGARARDWSEVQEPTVRPTYAAVHERLCVGAGMRYLDVGCGAGLAAQMAAARGAQVCGIDASEAFLAVARARVPAGDFRQGDLEELPFADRSFDAVTGFNSFQFAANPAVALGEARRVTKPGGKIVIMTWGAPAGMEAVAVITSLRDLMPPAPPGTPGPFALSEEAALRRFASDAGLAPGDIVDVDNPLAYADLATALRGLGSSGGAVRAIELAGEKAVQDAHEKALAPYRQSDGSYRIGARFRCLFATT
jgi:SAM-dependent methyltransferase